MLYAALPEGLECQGPRWTGYGDRGECHAPGADRRCLEYRAADSLSPRTETSSCGAGWRGEKEKEAGWAG